MSGSNKTGFISFIENTNGWADFFITRIGLILFAAILLLSALKIYPMFQERESRLYLDAITSDISSNIEAVDGVSIHGYKYNYVFEEKNSHTTVAISTEYISAHTNISFVWGEKRSIHAEPVMTHVYPPNSNWNNTSDFRKYVSENIGRGRNGDVSSPLDFVTEKPKVDKKFDAIKKELAQRPYIPDLNKPMFIEKVVLYYNNFTEIQERDYVFIFQK